MRMLPVDTAITVFVNATALIDDTDFKTREEAVVFDQAGIDLVWNFETTAGVITQTAVTPTDGLGSPPGIHDWTNVGNGMYKIEIPAAGGTINNDTEGYGFFSGFATGILPWTGPTYTFAPAPVVNGLVTGTGNLPVDAVQSAGTNLNAPGTTGGLVVVGSNAAITFTGGITVTQSASNQPGLSITGNGSGSGILSTGGATGHGAEIAGGASAPGNHGLYCTSTGNGHAIYGFANGTGFGLRARGGTSSGAGAEFIGVGGNSPGIQFVGQGSAAGMFVQGGTTGIGLDINGGATSGDGVTITTTDGHGVNIAPLGSASHGIRSFGSGGAGIYAGGNGAFPGILAAGGSTAAGVAFYGGVTSGNGVDVISFNGHGVNIAPVGTNAHGILATGDNGGSGLSLQGNGGGAGLLSTGGITGAGASITGGATSGVGLSVQAVGGNSRALQILGSGNQQGVYIAPGSTGTGIYINGGGTSGPGVQIVTTNGHGVNIAPAGTNAHGMLVTGGDAGVSDGIKAVAGTGGVDIRGAITLGAAGSEVLTEGYRAPGAAGTINQLLYEILALSAEKAISGTTLTALQTDQVTPAGTYTLDSATQPSSITRAT